MEFKTSRGDKNGNVRSNFVRVYASTESANSKSNTLSIEGMRGTITSKRIICPSTFYFPVCAQSPTPTISKDTGQKEEDDDILYIYASSLLESTDIEFSELLLELSVLSASLERELTSDMALGIVAGLSLASPSIVGTVVRTKAKIAAPSTDVVIIFPSRLY
jgi:hypothetical protein